MWKKKKIKQKKPSRLVQKATYFFFTNGNVLPTYFDGKN